MVKKTTLRKRLLTLGISIASFMGVIQMGALTFSAYRLSVDNADEFGRYVVQTSAGTMSEEISFLESCLETAQVSADGDATFDKVFMYGDDTGYTYSALDSKVNQLTKGELFISSPVEKADGSKAFLALYKRDDGVIAGELSYEYFVAILDPLRINDGDIGMVVYNDGSLIMSSDYEKTTVNENILTKYSEFQQMFAEMNSETAKNLVISDSFSGYLRTHYSFVQLENSDMCIIYGTNYFEVVSSYYNVLALSVWIFVALLAASIIYTIVVSKKVSASIVPVTDRLVKLSEGDIKSEAEISNRGDETQILSEAMTATIKAISMYINDIEYVLSNIAQGNLNIESSVEYKGDFSEIKKSLEKIRLTLKGTITDIMDAGEQVTNGSSMVAKGAQTLAETSSEEAATLEELNSMLTDVHSKIDSNAVNTEKARKLSNAVEKNVSNGNTSMEEMAGSMTDIKQASDEIQSVIKLIDDIAFQTNILALNAAVEAARAGEAGKGFAVVADEVRNLAGKSADAVQRTSQLIKKCSEAVEHGSKLTDEVYTALREINTSISEFGGLIENIADASEEQSKAMQQINIGLEQITSAVQSNSATAEESAASAEELSGQAQILNNHVQYFNK